MIGQIGTAKSATKFLESLRNNQDIARTAFVTSGRLSRIIILEAIIYAKLS